MRTLTDAHGNPAAGSRAAVDGYDHAVDRLLRFDPAVVDAMVALTREHPAFPMGHVLAGYLMA
ncbi:MAG TPA: hypothetical protein VF743_13370, partial [Acidimicrobiales bacterium]